MQADVLRLLQTVDAEFYPPLSARHGTTQTDFVDDHVHTSIWNYFSQMLHQMTITATVGGRLAGLMSIICGYNLPEARIHPPSYYVSTVAVEPQFRRNGIAASLYQALFDFAVRPSTVATRTWSTNLSHLALLQKDGFEVTLRRVGDRSPNIDTVYLTKALP